MIDPPGILEKEIKPPHAVHPVDCILSALFDDLRRIVGTYCVAVRRSESLGTYIFQKNDTHPRQIYSLVDVLQNARESCKRIVHNKQDFTEAEMRAHDAQLPEMTDQFGNVFKQVRVPSPEHQEYMRKREELAWLHSRQAEMEKIYGKPSPGVFTSIPIPFWLDLRVSYDDDYAYPTVRLSLRLRTESGLYFPRLMTVAKGKLNLNTLAAGMERYVSGTVHPKDALLEFKYHYEKEEKHRKTMQVPV